MARQPRSAQEQGEPAQESAQEQGEPRFVLARNHGMVVAGRSRFYPAGTEFDANDDGALISALVRSGATFE